MGLPGDTPVITFSVSSSCSFDYLRFEQIKTVFLRQLAPIRTSSAMASLLTRGLKNENTASLIFLYS